MALRIRKNGQILCAALNLEKEGDIYIDDVIHSRLCQKKVIVTFPEPEHSATGGQWWWKGEELDKDSMDAFWYEG